MSVSSPVLRLALGAVLISFSPILVKMLGDESMGPTVIGFWRQILGAMTLFIWAILRRQSLLISRSVIWPVMAAGLLFFLDLFFWHRSIIYTGAGMATVLGNTQVFGTALLSWLIFRERLSLRFVVAATSAIVGVVLLIGVGSDIEFTSIYARGVVYGLMTGVVYAGYIVSLRLAGTKREKPDYIVIMAWTSLISSVWLYGSAEVEQAVILPAGLYAFGLCLLLAVLVQALGWWSISSSLPSISGARVGLILLLQPILASVWGIVFLGESFTALQGVGGVITLAAIFLGSVRVSATK